MMALATTEAMPLEDLPHRSPLLEGTITRFEHKSQAARDTFVPKRSGDLAQSGRPHGRRFSLAAS